MTSLAEITRAQPEAFTPAHLPRAWAALCERLRDPVEVREEKGLRVVELLGCLRYLVMPGPRRVHFSYATGRGRFRVGESKGTVALDPPLPGTHWLAHFAADWLVSRGTEVAPAQFVEFARGLRSSHAFAELQARVEACRITEKLRTALAAALALDRQVIDDARLGLTQGPAATVESGDYNEAWRYREGFAQLRRENPKLLRAYAGAVIGKRLGNHPEPARDLKLAFRRVGIGDAGWKLLLAADPESLEAATPGAANASVFPVLCWALEACLRMGRVPPPAVMARIVSPNLREPGVRRTLRLADLQYDFWPPFLRALGRRLDTVRGPEALSQFLDGEFEDVYDWLEWDSPVIDANQARAGWPWLLAQRQRWEERERQGALAVRDEFRWLVPLREFAFEGFRVTALADAYELWEEGQAMRHCARTYAASCRRGGLVLFSIRGADGRRAATGSISLRAGTWTVESVRTFCNRHAGTALWRVAQAYARACSLSPLPWECGRE